jgi:hypothetical protein
MTREKMAERREKDRKVRTEGDRGGNRTGAERTRTKSSRKERRMRCDGFVLTHQVVNQQSRVRLLHRPVHGEFVNSWAGGHSERQYAWAGLSALAY